MRLYTDLADWWPLLASSDAFAEEAAAYLHLLDHPRSILELGSGAGSLARHWPPDVDAVLLDRSPQMLAVSREANPDRTHVEADMRTARLDRTFDAVLVHDAVMYLTSEADLAACLHTAAVHTRPGGLALFVPDVTRDSFCERVLSGGGADPHRAAALMEWHWDPDPTDDTFQVELALLLRSADGTVRSVHEQHTMGLFSAETWLHLLTEAGLDPIPPPATATELGDVFLTRRR